MSEPYTPAPRRYGTGADGQPQRLFNGKTAEKFAERDTLLFAIDTDLRITGGVLPETLAEIEKSGYHYKNGVLTPQPSEPDKRSGPMETEKTTLEMSVKVYPMKDTGNLLAFASVTFGGCFSVSGIRVMDSEKGRFVAMPSRKDNDGSYHDICCPTTADMRKALNAAVLGEYSRSVEKTSVRGALQEAAKEAAVRPAQTAPATDRGER